MGSMLDNRPAAAGGTLGMLLVGLLGVLVTQTSGAEIVDEGLEELPFTPGLMVALGSPEAEGNAVSSSLESASEPAESSEVAEPSEAEPSEAETEPETETDDVQSRSPRPPRPGPSRPVGRPNPGPGPSPLPAVGAASSPDPFGSPSGFGDLEREGDPWATSVLAALEDMNVGTAYAKPIEGTVRFQLTVCKDGRVSRVSYKGGSASLDERDRVLFELGRLRIPRLPSKLAAQMKGSCARLRYTFSWSTAGAS